MHPTMATRKGLEPSTSGVTGRRSNQLNYRAIFVSYTLKPGVRRYSAGCTISQIGQSVNMFARIFMKFVSVCSFRRE